MAHNTAMPLKPLMKPLSQLFRAAPAPPPVVVAPVVTTTLTDSEAATHAEAAQRLREAETIAASHDPQQLAKFVLEGSSSPLRQLAAQRIEDPQVLKGLLKQVRGKDKSAYQIIKHKWDGLRAEQQRVTQLESEIVAHCIALEGLSLRLYDPLYAPAFEHFEARWRAHENEAPTLIQARAHQAIDRCRQVIAEHHREIADREARTAEQAAQRAALQAAQQWAIAEAAEAVRCREEAAALAATESAKSREQQEQMRRERLAAEALAVRQIGTLMAKAQGALRDGHTRPAAGLRRAIEEKLPAVPVPASLARQVQILDAKLHDLKEWKDYAVAPKRTELIAEMEALIGSSEPPNSLAGRIRDLREQWKTISSGLASESETDWQRFNQAALTAYQPCHEYFEIQARIRAENLDRRRSVLARLLTFEAAQAGEPGAEPTNWRAVSIVLREAQQEWRNIVPIDRVAIREAQQDFSAALGRLRTRLDTWYAQNAADKRTLIERAQQILARAEGRESVEAIKTLQRQWQDVGPVQREQQELLWLEFRRQCDAVFDKRQQAHAEYAASLEASKASAIALCEQVEQAATQTGAALIEVAAKMPEWRTEFEKIGELPRADERALWTRFERALKQCDGKISQQRARDVEQSFTHLLEAARRIKAYGWAVAQGAAVEARDARKQDAETFLAGIQHWPKGSAPALKDAWSKAEAATAGGIAANEAALRNLCIRNEIFNDLATPVEDQTLRREYQLQRLVQGMGQHREAPDSGHDALALEWVRVGPVSTAVHDSLLVRLLNHR